MRFDGRAIAWDGSLSCRSSSRGPLLLYLFEVGAAEFLSYDKGVDPDSGKALWGAILGPYCFAKQRDVSDEFPQ
jgi:hypothetical protein